MCWDNLAGLYWGGLKQFVFWFLTWLLANDVLQLRTGFVGLWFMKAEGPAPNELARLARRAGAEACCFGWLVDDASQHHIPRSSSSKRTTQTVEFFKQDFLGHTLWLWACRCFCWQVLETLRKLPDAKDGDWQKLLAHDSDYRSSSAAKQHCSRLLVVPGHPICPWTICMACAFAC